MNSVKKTFGKNAIVIFKSAENNIVINLFNPVDFEVRFCITEMDMKLAAFKPEPCP